MTLDQTFAALSDPTRRAILAQLTLGEATAGDLARPHKLTQPTISKHLKALEQAGLITSHIDGNNRLKRLRPEALQGIDHWLAPFRQQWTGRFERLAAIVETSPEDEKEI